MFTYKYITNLWTSNVNLKLVQAKQYLHLTQMLKLIDSTSNLDILVTSHYQKKKKRGSIAAF